MWFGHWFRKKSATKQPAAGRRVSLALERLEDRRVPSVTYAGGAVLPTVEVQALYYGSDWSTSTYQSQAGYLDGFLNGVVHSSYMDMLGNAGYGVGRGSFDAGKVAPVNVNRSTYLTDAQLQSALQSNISNGALKSPDANRLYVIFVEDNVAVSTGFGTSQGAFLGYHGAFAGRNAAGNPADIHYAVVTYPGGGIGNASISWLSALGDMTQVASHELAEAVTDPNVGYKALGWYDPTLNEEVADITNGQTVYLNGYAVQRVADRNDQAMTPAGATASVAGSFVLQTNGNLSRHTSAGWTSLLSGVASISDQGIDDYGHAMIDVVTGAGAAYEYRDGLGFYPLTSGVKAAAAGQGVSYVLLTSGALYEYTDATGGWTSLATGVASISAGTDREGVNMVDAVSPSGAAWEDSDSSGWHSLASGVASVSAGQQGASALLLANGNAYWYSEASNTSTLLASGVAAVTAGYDAGGNFMIDLVYSGGATYEYRAGVGWKYLAGGVQSLSKARAGLVDLVFGTGAADEHTASGTLSVLTNGVLQAV